MDSRSYGKIKKILKELGMRKIHVLTETGIDCLQDSFESCGDLSLFFDDIREKLEEAQAEFLALTDAEYQSIRRCALASLDGEYSPDFDPFDYFSEGVYTLYIINREILEKLPPYFTGGYSTILEETVLQNLERYAYDETTVRLAEPELFEVVKPLVSAMERREITLITLVRDVMENTELGPVGIISEFIGGTEADKFKNLDAIGVLKRTGDVVEFLRRFKGKFSRRHFIDFIKQGIPEDKIYQIFGKENVENYSRITQRETSNAYTGRVKYVFALLCAAVRGTYPSILRLMIDSIFMRRSHLTELAVFLLVAFSIRCDIEMVEFLLRKLRQRDIVIYNFFRVARTPLLLTKATQFMCTLFLQQKEVMDIIPERQIVGGGDPAGFLRFLETTFEGTLMKSFLTLTMYAFRKPPVNMAEYPVLNLTGIRIQQALIALALVLPRDVLQQRLQGLLAHSVAQLETPTEVFRNMPYNGIMMFVDEIIPMDRATVEITYTPIISVIIESILLPPIIRHPITVTLAELQPNLDNVLWLITLYLANVD